MMLTSVITSLEKDIESFKGRIEENTKKLADYETKRKQMAYLKKYGFENCPEFVALNYEVKCEREVLFGDGKKRLADMEARLARFKELAAVPLNQDEVDALDVIEFTSMHAEKSK